MAETGMLDGHIALVTGANRGIGRTIAQTFLAEGSVVAITGRDRRALENTAAELDPTGDRLLPVRADVGVETDVTAVVTQVVKKWGPVSVLVNNAASSGPTQPAHEMSTDDFCAVLDTNLVGPFLTAKYTLPGMIDAGCGSIVNIGSIAGVEAYPLRSPYSASKWGLVGLTKTLAGEAGKHGVRVNLVAPGPTEGQRSSDVIRNRADALGLPFEELHARYESEIPLRRFVTSSEVASAVLFLASNASSGMTGQSFCVSGGIEI